MPVNETGCRPTKQISPEMPCETRFHLALDIVLQALQFSEKSPRDISNSISQVHSIISNGFPAAIIVRLREQVRDIVTKIIFYGTWRAVALGEFFIHKSGLEGLTAVLEQEFKIMIRELNDLAEDREYHEEKSVDFATYTARKGLYSENGSLSPKKFAELESQLLIAKQPDQLFDENDARRFRILTGQSSIEILKNLTQKIDVIITDPPYGFNKDDGDSRQMQTLYVDFVNHSLRALKDNGQLLISLPDFAKNGKQIAYYQTRNMLLRQIFTAAYDANKEIIQYNRPRPQPENLVGPPYFWGTTGVLSRSILHFFVRSR